MTTQELGNALLQLIVESVNTIGNFDSIFKRKPDSKIEELSNANFLLKLKNELI